MIPEDDQRTDWDDWTRPAGIGGLLLLTLAPVLAVGLVAWLIARALGLGTLAPVLAVGLVAWLIARALGLGTP